jgi:hypothetical protein
MACEPGGVPPSPPERTQGQVNPSHRQQSTVLSQALVAMSIATTLIQVKAAAQGSIQGLLLILVAALLAMAGATPPDQPSA